MRLGCGGRLRAAPATRSILATTARVARHYGAGGKASHTEPIPGQAAVTGELRGEFIIFVVTAVLVVFIDARQTGDDAEHFPGYFAVISISLGDGGVERRGLQFSDHGTDSVNRSACCPMVP